MRSRSFNLVRVDSFEYSSCKNPKIPNSNKGLCGVFSKLSLREGPLSAVVFELKELITFIFTSLIFSGRRNIALK